MNKTEEIEWYKRWVKELKNEVLLYKASTIIFFLLCLYLAYELNRVSGNF